MKKQKEDNIMKKILVIVMALAMGFSSLHAQKYGKTPEDSIKCLQNLSVYGEFYKQKNYAGAYDAWKQVLELCPATSLNTYIRGSVILKQMMAATKDPAQRAQYFEELMKLWDMRAQYYGRPGYCLGMKAQDMRTYAPSKIQDAMELFNQALAYANEPNFINIPYFYFECVRDAYKANLISKDDLFAAYDKATTILEDIAEMNPADTTADAMMNTVSRLFEPYASCEDLVAMYTEKFEANKTNAEFLRKATKMLASRGCTDSEIFFQLTDALYEMHPTPESAYLMAQMCNRNEEFGRIGAFLNGETISQLPENQRENAYLLVANACWRLNHYGDGRRACNNALKINPQSGRAYLLLGMLYASGADACPGDGTPVAKRAPFWAAVDMFIKAKSVDPEVAEAANTAINTYSQHFPSADDLFTYGLREGSTYQISCWFTHTTTIRAAK